MTDASTSMSAATKQLNSLSNQSFKINSKVPPKLATFRSGSAINDLGLSIDQT